MDVKLKAKHIIMLSKLVAKMGITIDVTEQDRLKLGAKIVMDLISNIHLAESEFYELIGSLANTSPEIAAETEIEELYDVLKEVVNKLINFIQRRKESAT